MSRSESIRWLVKRELASQRMPTGELYKTIHHKKLQFRTRAWSPHRHCYGTACTGTCTAFRQRGLKRRRSASLDCCGAYVIVAAVLACSTPRFRYSYHKLNKNRAACPSTVLRRRSLPQVATGAPPRRSGVKAAKWWVLKNIRRLLYRREVRYQSRALRCEAARRHGGTTAKWVAAETTKEAAEPVSSR
jgi:hypothetical protein